MPKVDFKLPNGTTIQIDGSVEDAAKLLALFNGGNNAVPTDVHKKAGKKKKANRKTSKKTAVQKDDDERFDASEIVNLIKDSDEAEEIEKTILDRSGQVNRTLLPLYILHENEMGDRGLSSLEIAKVTKELGVPISQPNVSRTLAGTASKYVMADRSRAKGQRTGYQISRRGVQYMKSVISGGSSEE